MLRKETFEALQRCNHCRAKERGVHLGALTEDLDAKADPAAISVSVARGAATARATLGS